MDLRSNAAVVAIRGPMVKGFGTAMFSKGQGMIGDAQWESAERCHHYMLSMDKVVGINKMRSMDM